MMLGKHVVLCVTGSIAAYKAADLASKLVQAGAIVDVAMTSRASEFVTALTFRSLTHRPVVQNIFDADSGESIEHVTLAEAADIVVVAPATANTIAKMANGLADDAVTCMLLATKAPVIIAPAMDGNMFQNPATARNLALLAERGIVQVGPAAGRLASGLTGMGRMAEVPEILGMVHKVLGRNGDLAGKRVVVTAGGTQEPIDPVRVITNRSSGKMGYAIAEAARDRGADVTLVTTPTALPRPVGMRTLSVETVAQMRQAVLAACKDADVLVMAAAVSDFRPAEVAGHKIKKGADAAGMSLRLVRNPDFFLEVPPGVLRVGFAAESEDLLENARTKLKAKNMDLIVANDITAADSGFAVDTNRVTIIDRQGQAMELPLLLKSEVAHRIWDLVAAL